MKRSFAPLSLLTALLVGWGGDLHVDTAAPPLDAEAVSALTLGPAPAPCGGHWRAQQLGIQPPRYPGPYPAPRGDVYVQTPMQLIQALAQTTPQTIVLAPTTFDRTSNHPAPSYPFSGTPKTTYVTARAGHTVIASFSGGSRLKFGIYVPLQASGLTVKGVTFDIDHELDGVPDTQAWFHPTNWFSSAILVWGGTSDVTIEDVRIIGNQRLHVGIWAPSAEALRIRRVAVVGVRRYGLRIGNLLPVAVRPVIEDVYVNGVYDHAFEAYVAALPSQAQIWGRQLHGINLGTPADLRRVRVRRVAHSGVALGNTVVPMQGALLEHIDVDDVDLSNHTLGTGVYFERQQLSPRLRRFCVGPDVDRGVQIEWGHAPGTDDPNAHCSDPTAQPVPSDDVRVRAGLIRAQFAGVNVGLWTRGTRLRNLHFENASYAAVAALDNQGAGTNTMALNLTFGALNGGCKYTLTHPNASTIPCVPGLPAPTQVQIPPPCPSKTIFIAP